GSTSREDPREAEYVADLAEALLAAGLPATDLAAISPYDDQVRRIDDRLEAEGVEVDTVDGFQGRERELALVSLARSSERSEVGFLSDERRFNVSLTRVRSKAVVGDADTGTSECVYDDFVDYVRGRADGRVAALGS
ncbi:IGHMBP2 family helicase, partial [Halobacteriales archaeon QS_5_70_17]